jgi:crotonobetainyl-CoA:carnitine CoA-transferase CaiB-like acyl-CoA transferase
VSTSIVNAGLLGTSYAWISADGTPGEWPVVDRDQYGLSPFYRLYETAEGGWLFVAAVTDTERRAFAGALETSLDDTDAFASAAEAKLRERPAAAWFDDLDRAGVPVEVVDETFCRDLFDDPEARARGLISQTWAGGVGRFEDPGLLVDLSATPGIVRRGPCLCGEHTREILRELGCSDAEVDELAAAGVVLDAPVTPSR